MGRKRKYRETTTCRCMNCGVLFDRRTAELKRNGKKGRLVYCGLSCLGKAHCDHLKNIPSNTSGLIANNRKDEFSPFREFLKIAKRRNKDEWEDCNLTLDYIKDLWESQEGLCAVTNIKLFIYPTTNWSGKTKPYQASLDRIDNSKGYIKGNVRFVALIFNFARNRFTDEEVLQFIKDSKA